jgi:hypothetical protein
VNEPHIGDIEVPSSALDVIVSRVELEIDAPQIALGIETHTLRALVEAREHLDELALAIVQIEPELRARARAMMDAFASLRMYGKAEKKDRSSFGSGIGSEPGSKSWFNRRVSTSGSSTYRPDGDPTTLAAQARAPAVAEEPLAVARVELGVRVGRHSKPRARSRVESAVCRALVESLSEPPSPTRRSDSTMRRLTRAHTLILTGSERSKSTPATRSTRARS